MKILVGQIGTTGRWRVQITAGNVVGGRRIFEHASREIAERQARQLAGGDAQRIRRTVFVEPAAPVEPAPPAEAPMAEPPPPPVPAVELKGAAEVPASGVVSTSVVDEFEEIAAKADVLVGESAKSVVKTVGSGVWDDALGILETAERTRENGPRVTVLRAIEARRKTAADA